MNRIQCHFSLLFVLTLAFSGILQAQISIKETHAILDPSAILDFQNTDKGLLIPRMTSSERDAINQPSVGFQIYNTDESLVNVFDGTA
ncbi:MAG: hypothetical protein AAF587_43590 [Bacteroidota bacterium]